MEESPYELNGHQVLELIINTLHPYRGKLKFETKRELSNRNKILHVIRRITGRTVFDQAWTIIRQNNINRIYGQKEPHHDFSKNLYFYFISRKKPKKCYIRPVLTFLPTVFHCSCKQYRKNFKRKRYVTICCHLLAIMLAKALDMFSTKSMYVTKIAVKLLLHAKMKKLDLNTLTFHKLATAKVKPPSVRRRRRKKPKPKPKTKSKPRKKRR